MSATLSAQAGSRKTTGPSATVDNSSAATFAVSGPDAGLEAAFFGAGRRRSPEDSAAAAIRAEADQRTAEALASVGLCPWRSDDAFTCVDLATEGRLASAPVRELRPWCVFGTVARRDAAQAAAELASFLASEDPEVRGSRDVVCLTLRRRSGGDVPTNELAAHHKAFTEKLGRMTEYAQTWGGPCTLLSSGVHHRMVGNGAFVDLHGHMTAYVRRGVAGDAALAKLTEYLGRGFVVFERAGLSRTPADDLGASAAAAYYEEDGFLGPTEGSEEERTVWLAVYVRQVHIDHHLHRRNPLGPLRRHVGELRRERVRPALVRPGEAGAEALHSTAPTPMQPSTVTPESFPAGGSSVPGCPPGDPVSSPSSGAAAPLSPPQPAVVIYRPIRPRPDRRPRPPPFAAGPRVLSVGLSWRGGRLWPVLRVKGWDHGDHVDSWRRLGEAYYLDPLVGAARVALARPDEEARAAKEEAKRVAGLVAKYEAHVRAMRKRGAVPDAPMFLPLGTKGEGSPEVMAAYRAALDATADATRRQADRAYAKQQRKRAEERRASFAAWARAGDMAAHEKFLMRQNERWDRLLHGKDGEDRVNMEAARRSTFRRYRQEWFMALRAAGHPYPTPPRKVHRTTPDAMDR